MRFVCSLMMPTLLSGFIAVSAVAQAQTKRSKTELVTFYAMGDVPYQSAEDELLPRQIAELPSDAEFVVHVGDIKDGSTPCDEAVYIKVSRMLSRSQAPVFIIPGDNEWNDCAEPDEAWRYWNRYFLRFDGSWHHRFRLFRQLEHEENLSFVKNGVLFIGINIVGGHIHDPDEWKQRHADTLRWVQRNLAEFGNEVSSMVLLGHANPQDKHRDFFEPFSTEARKFGKPVLYLHGDGHRWIYDRPFEAKNILRVQVDQGGIAPPLRVTVSDHAQQPFHFDRRNGKTP